MMFTVRTGEPNYFKCHCQRCGGHIEFPSNGAGMTINCPHCGKKTVLGVMGGSAAPGKSSKAFWVTIALAVVIGGGAMAFIWSHKQKVAAATLPQKAVSAPVVPMAKTKMEAPQAISQQAPAADTVNNFDVSKIFLEKMPGSSLVYAVGTLKNDVDRRRFGVRVELNQLDENGQKLGVVSDYVSVMDPHKAWQFKAVLTSPHVAKVTVADIKEQQ